MKMQAQELSRRSFLAASAAVASAAGLALAGCNPDRADKSRDVENTPTAEATTASASAGSSPTPHGYVCTSDWLGEPPAIEQDAISEVVDTDVLVIGGGNTGIQAQLAAAEGGAKVDVIEKKPADPRRVAAEDVGHVNSQWLIGQGFGPYDEGEIVNDFFVRGGGRCNVEHIRRFIANSGEMFDNMVSLVSWPNDSIKVWREEDKGFSPLDPSQCIVMQPGASLDGDVEYPIVRGGFKGWPCTAMFMGTIVHEPQTEAGVVASYSRLDEFQQFAILRAEELGATWHCGETGVKLLTDDSGSVTGAITQREDGSYAQYNASKGVILATGDISANQNMVYNLLTEDAEWLMRAGGAEEEIMGRGNTGDGQRMGCWVGGAIETSPRARVAVTPSGCPWGYAPMLTLNSAGKRYMNEANVQGVVWETRMQPIGLVTTITDANFQKSVKLGSFDHFAPNFGRIDYWNELLEDMGKVVVDDPAGYDVRCMFIAERDVANVVAASTIEGLLSMLGYEGDALETAIAQVKRYNELCAQGSDADFGKDSDCMIPIDTPPFYGMRRGHDKGATLRMNTALAGLLVDEDLRVLKVDDGSYRPIPNLYAAGCCSSAHQSLGNNQSFSGSLLGMCMTLGRVAGKIITGQEVK